MDDLDIIVSDDLPQVNENAINAVMVEKEDKINEVKKTKGFDPEIHATDDEGNPLYTKSGNLKKKRGRKKGQSTAQSTLNLDDKKEELIEDLSSYDTAVTISGILEVAQVKIISDEFIYNELERTANITAWQKTLDYYGGVSLTPPQQLALSHMQIILARFQKEKTREKVTLGWFYLKSKIGKIFKRGKKDNGTHDNRGEDGKRENDASKENSEKISTKGD